MDRTLSAAATRGQSGPGSNGSEGVLHIAQIFKDGALLSDALMSYLGHSLGVGSYPSAEMQSVYSTGPSDWAPIFVIRPTSVRVWYKAVFRWVQSQGRSPDASGTSKNASGPVGISLFGAPQAPSDKPHLSEEG